MTSVLFLGLGSMGGGMAGRLLEGGFPLTVWNRGAGRADALAARGARVAASPRDAAPGAKVIIAMVADDGASRSIWLGSEGALAGARPGTLLIESSTLSPAWIEELGAAASAAGCTLVEAPVTGSKTQAAAGSLKFLTGGSSDAVDRARPVLLAMGSDILHLGPLGSGARMKLINNFLCGVQAASLAEGLSMIERSGLDRDAALAVLTAGAPGSPLFKAVGARMVVADYAVNFRLSLMRKDLGYAIDEAATSGLTLTTAITARELFSKGVEAGLGDQDFSAVVEIPRKNN